MGTLARFALQRAVPQLDAVAGASDKLSKGMSYMEIADKLPIKKEIIEGIGYPGQKGSAGCVVTLGRITYGPHRYDYGRVKMPKGWFANYFYGFWELGHIFFVSDRWMLFRIIRHIVATYICFLPFWLTAEWNKQSWEQFKQEFPN